MRHKKTTTAILFSLLSLSLAVSGSASWIIMSPSVNVPVNKEDAVCYIEETGEYFSSVEGAIYEANLDNAARKVIVIPGVTTTIENSIALNSGVDLLLPYNTNYDTNISDTGQRTKLSAPKTTEISKDNNNLYTAKYLYPNANGTTNYPKKSPYMDTAEYDPVVSTFSDSSNLNYLSSTLILKENITLTVNNGSQFVVYGQLGRPSAGLSGATCGYYSQIIMMPNSKIQVNQGGILDVRGYIKEGYKTASPISNGNKRVTNNSSIINCGTIYMPFVIYDYGGGNNTVAVYMGKNECPFSMYDLPNIHSTIHTQNGGLIKARADLYTGYTDFNQYTGGIPDWMLGMFGLSKELLIVYTQHNTCFIDILGTTNSAIINIDNNSSATTKYYPNSYMKFNTKYDGKDIYIGLTQNTYAIGRTDGYGSTTDIKLVGNISTNFLLLSVAVFGHNIDITTDGAFFPIPWQFNIMIGSNNLNQSTLNIFNKLKFMPGSILNLENTQVRINDEIIFYDEQWQDPASSYKYPSNNEAIFTSNNCLISFSSSTKFGGYLQTTGNTNIKAFFSTVNNNNTVSSTDSGGAELSMGYLDTSEKVDLAKFVGNGEFTPDVQDILKKASVIDYTTTYSNTAKISVGSKDTIQQIENSIKQYSSEENKEFFNAAETIPVNNVLGKVVTNKSEIAPGKGHPIESEFVNALIYNSEDELITDYENLSITWSVDNKNNISIRSANNPNEIYVSLDSINNMATTRYLTVTIMDGNGTQISASIICETIGYTFTFDINEGKDISSGDGKEINQTVKAVIKIDSELKVNLGIEDDYSNLTALWNINPGETNGEIGLDKNNLGTESIETTISSSGESSIYLSVPANEGQNDKSGDLSVSLKLNDIILLSDQITFTASSCLLPGSLITMADGSSKPIEELGLRDMIKSFSFVTGQYEDQMIIYYKEIKDQLTDVITLRFDDGSEFKIAQFQSLFDMNELEYFEINTENYKDVIGKQVMGYDNGKVKTKTIINTTYEQYRTSVYEIITSYNYNFVADNTLTVDPLIGDVNLFEINDNLTYDFEQMQQDIATYGLYTYEDFKPYATKEQFELYNVQYLKVAVGKGLLTFDFIVNSIERYKKYSI